MGCAVHSTLPGGRRLHDARAEGQLHAGDHRATPAGSSARADRPPRRPRRDGRRADRRRGLGQAARARHDHLPDPRRRARLGPVPLPRWPPPPSRSPRSARPPAAQRARWRSSTPPPRTPRSSAMADALERRAPEILEANARDMEAGEQAGLHSGLLDRLRAGRGSGSRGSRRTCAAIAALPDPVGRDDRGLPARERARRAARARAARRGGGGLRGAPERDRRLLGALPQVRQRDRAARVVDGGSLERRARAGRLRGGRRRRACPRARSRSSPAATATSCASWRRRTASST